MVAAFLLLGVMQTVGYALSHPSPAFGSDILAVFNKASYSLPLPYAYRQAIESMPGVALVSVSGHVSGYYRDPKNSLTAEAVDPAPFFTMRSDQIGVSKEQLHSLETTRIGAIAGPRIAQKYGWRIGDHIYLHADGKYIRRNGSLDWPFIIIGIFKVKDPAAMAQLGDRFEFQYAYLDAARMLNQGKVDLFLVKPAAGMPAEQIAQAIDARFANSPYETRSTPLRALAVVILKQFGDIGFLIDLITAAVLGALAFMTANAMMHTFHERIPEFATLKTIGFSGGLLAILIVAESITTCALGAAAGIGGAYLLLHLLKNSLNAIDLSPVGLLPALAFALILAVAVGLIPGWRAQRLKIVDALSAGQ
jgi:putative ABC transport system permease protein